MKEKVLQAMREFGAPVNAGKRVEEGRCDCVARPLQVAARIKV